MEWAIEHAPDPDGLDSQDDVCRRAIMACWKAEGCLTYLINLRARRKATLRCTLPLTLGTFEALPCLSEPVRT